MADELDFGSNLLSLLDEEGNEHEFEILDEVDVDDNHYVALIPTSEADADDDEEGQLIVLRSEEEEGEEYLAYIENEEEFNKVSKIFVDRLSEEYDIKD